MITSDESPPTTPVIAFEYDPSIDGSISPFEPETETGDNPLIGDEPWPAVTPLPEEETEAPGQPGFSAGMALVGAGTAALLKRVLRIASE